MIREADEWINIGESFDDYRRGLDPMRSIDHSGEVAEYMLKLSLNELGRSFLAVDNYVSQNHPYTNVRPKK